VSWDSDALRIPATAYVQTLGAEHKKLPGRSNPLCHIPNVETLTVRKVLTGLFLILYSEISFAQPDTLSHRQGNNTIEIDFGFVHTRLIDEGFTQSKLLFRGTNFKVGLGYARKFTQAIFNFRTTLSDGNISTKQNDWAASFTTFSAAIEYLRCIRTSDGIGKGSQLFAGLHLSTQNYLTQNDPIFDNVDILSLHGIYFKLNYDVTLTQKQKLQLRYALPAAVYGNQVLWNSGASVYDVNDLDNIVKLVSTHGRFHYFGIFRNIPVELVYKIKIGSSVDFNVRYAFMYVNYSVEKPLRLYSNELLLGLKFNF
jgi:hypothetical protein